MDLTKPDAAVDDLKHEWAFWKSRVDVAMNRGLGRMVGVNETGFAGSVDAAYRRQAWEFIVAGGGLLSQLKYFFTVGHEDGRASHSTPASSPMPLPALT